jgi:hypothetical protein
MMFLTARVPYDPKLNPESMIVPQSLETYP